ncbi:MAG: hypothetical protein ACE5HL_11140 [Terriglobia bacterium]
MGSNFAKHLLVIAALLASGCAPSIQNLQIQARKQGEPIPVDADVRPWLTTVGTPTLGVGPYPPPHGPYRDAGQMSKKPGIHYQGNLQNLEYGAYELRLMVPYRVFAFLGYANRTETAVETFLVNAPDCCFSFDGGRGTSGWTLDAIYDGDTPNAIGTCDPTLAWSGVNWPVSLPGDARGSIWVFMQPDAVGGCFPTDPSVANLWRIDFISPDLETRPDWQGISGYRFRFMAGVPGITIQPLLKVRKSNNQIVFFRPVDSAGSPVFYQIDSGQGWHEIEFRLPESATILNVVVRVFGDTDQVFWGGTEGAVNLDGVCPIP